MHFSEITAAGRVVRAAQPRRSQGRAIDARLPGVAPRRVTHSIVHRHYPVRRIRFLIFQLMNVQIAERRLFVFFQFRSRRIVHIAGDGTARRGGRASEKRKECVKTFAEKHFPLALFASANCFARHAPSKKRGERATGSSVAEPSQAILFRVCR